MSLEATHEVKKSGQATSYWLSHRSGAGSQQQQIQEAGDLGELSGREPVGTYALSCFLIGQTTKYAAMATRRRRYQDDSPREFRLFAGLLPIC